MATESDSIDVTLSKPKADEGEAKASSLPLEPVGRYEQPRSGGDLELGRGGMGRVLRLEDVHLEREVAIKELLPHHAPSSSSLGPTFSNLFVREAKVLAMLEHPGVVPIYELGQRADGTPYYSMRKIRGEKLTRAMQACSTFEERLSLLPHLVDVGHTVGFAHSRGVVHRDLKPDNVMVGSFGETLVVDWGLAVTRGDNDSEGQLAGTPAYMSPEQVDGKRLDARADVWTLGVMLYELLAGNLPFTASTVTALLQRVKTNPVPPIRRHEPRVPAALAAVVEKALQRDLSKRYESGEAFAEALERAMRERAARPPVLAFVTGALAIALVAGWWFSRSTIERLDQTDGAQRQVLADSRRARAVALAEASLGALRANDTSRADQLVKASLAEAEVPLARGVAMLLGERGVPTRRWTAPVEAGCSGVVTVGESIACATLNQVELFDAKTGAAVGKLSAGPGAGWLQAVAAVNDTTVAAGADNRVLSTWDVSRAKAPEAVTFPESITAVAAMSGGLVVGLRNGALFKQSRTGERVALPGLKSRVKALAASGDVFAAGGDGELLVAGGQGPIATLDRSALAFDFGPQGGVVRGRRALGAEARAGSPLDGVLWPSRHGEGHRGRSTAGVGRRRWRGAGVVRRRRTGPRVAGFCSGRARDDVDP